MQNRDKLRVFYEDLHITLNAIQNFEDPEDLEPLEDEIELKETWEEYESYYLLRIAEIKGLFQFGVN